MRKYGKDKVQLLNHDINPRYEDADIKRFKREVADYCGLAITYANINGITDPEKLPSQFEVCVEAGALTNQAGHALCTARLKTEPFMQFLKLHFPTIDDLFEQKKEVVIYYGFDLKEQVRIQRKSGILGAMGYRTDYVLATWKDRTIFSTKDIGIEPPLTYGLFEHANCIGCLKASLLHWYVVYVHYPGIYDEGVWMEHQIDFTIHTVIRNKEKLPISLTELKPIYEQMKQDGIPASEHENKMKFAHLLRKY